MSVEVSIRNEISSVGEDALNSSVIAIRPLRKRISCLSHEKCRHWLLLRHPWQVRIQPGQTTQLCVSGHLTDRHP